jgi:hypothetical protein
MTRPASERPIFTRRGRDTVVFVAVPTEPGRWFLAHKCVAVVACPKCGAGKGEPCMVAKQKRKREQAGQECRTCRRVRPVHRATACKERRKAYEALGGNAYPERIEHTRCASCKADYAVDPGTAVCPNCHAPRTPAAHYSRGAA